MIERVDYDLATQRAFDSVSEFMPIGATRTPRHLLVGSDEGGTPDIHAARMAKQTGEAHVIYSNQIRRGYGSWLMYTGKRRIAINKKQVKQWSLHHLPRISVRTGILERLVFPHVL